VNPAETNPADSCESSHHTFLVMFPDSFKFEHRQTVVLAAMAAVPSNDKALQMNENDAATKMYSERASAVCKEIFPTKRAGGAQPAGGKPKAQKLPMDLPKQCIVPMAPNPSFVRTSMKGIGISENAFHGIVVLNHCTLADMLFPSTKELRDEFLFSHSCVFIFAPCKFWDLQIKCPYCGEGSAKEDGWAKPKRVLTYGEGQLFILSKSYEHLQCPKAKKPGV
jgi:hypothetical protein